MKLCASIDVEAFLQVQNVGGGKYWILNLKWDALSMHVGGEGATYQYKKYHLSIWYFAYAYSDTLLYKNTVKVFWTQ